MDKWLWAYALSTIGPIAVLLCASMLPLREAFSAGSMTSLATPSKTMISRSTLR